MSKGKRYLSDSEKSRREEQSRKSPGGQQRDRRGAVVLNDPNTTFSLKYDLFLPGAPFRSPYSSQVSGKLVAHTEGDLLRDFILTAVEQFGYSRYVKAAAGVIADAVNSYPVEIREELFRMVATGAGLNVYTLPVTSCKACGAEQQVVTLLDPNAAEDEQTTEQDDTVHAPECPTQPQVDADAIAVAETDDDVVPLRPGQPLEWVTAPGVYIDNPQKFRPLFMKKKEEQPIPETETGEGESGEAVAATDCDD